jgi:hypothetical protein
VCRDFAHLAITFCRALNIPARYVFGYIPDIGVPLPDEPMDFSAWFEANLGGQWYTFDARLNTPRIGRVIVGRGRDAVDVALRTSFVAPTLTDFAVWSRVCDCHASASCFPDRDRRRRGCRAPLRNSRVARFTHLLATTTCSGGPAVHEGGNVRATCAPRSRTVRVVRLSAAATELELVTGVSSCRSARPRCGDETAEVDLLARSLSLRHQARLNDVEYEALGGRSPIGDGASRQVALMRRLWAEQTVTDGPSERITSAGIAPGAAADPIWFGARQAPTGGSISPTAGSAGPPDRSSTRRVPSSCRSSESGRDPACQDGGRVTFGDGGVRRNSSTTGVSERRARLALADRRP